MTNRVKVQGIVIADLMRLLPHRHPFLLIDRVVACEPGKSIRGYKNVTRSDTADDRGPITKGRARMPLLLVLEALAQLSVVLARKTLGQTADEEAMFFFAGIDDARFGEAAMPGERLELESSVMRIMPSRGVGKFATRATVGGRMVAEATMMAAMPTRRAGPGASP